MSRRLARWTCLAALTVVLAISPTGLNCARSDGDSQTGESVVPETESTAARPAVPASDGTQVRRELRSPQLLCEAMPERDTQPVLKRLMSAGWKTDAPLDADLKRLRSRFKRWSRIEVHEARFTSHDWQGKPVRVFGYYAYPAAHEGKLPALLLVHGGGGYATISRVTEAAGRGYAALSIDLPGKGPLRESHSRSTGPDMTVKQIFTVKPTLESNYLYNAVLAQMRSISFLCSRPEVDPERIGLFGVSWGGATGLLTASIDKRVKCFVDLFGSGLLWEGSTWHDYFTKLPEGEFQVWEDNFDASRYVSDISVPVLGVTGTNDNCYYLHRFMRTMRGIDPAPDLLLRANLDHKVDDAAHEAFYKWLDAQLKDAHEDSPPSLKSLRIEATRDGVSVAINAGGKIAVRRAEVCHGEVGGSGWTNRRWKTEKCKLGPRRTWWTAEVKLSAPLTYLFATVHFEDGSALSTPVHSIAQVMINGRLVALDTPFMYKDCLMAEAHWLAGLIDAEVAVDDQAGVATLTRAGKRARCEARPIGALRYIELRDACQKLGGIVAFEDGRAVISLATTKVMSHHEWSRP